MHRFGTAVLTLLASSLVSSGVAAQSSLYINQVNGPSVSSGYGRSNDGVLTAAIDGAFGKPNITLDGPTLGNLSALLSFDRLWLDFRFANSGIPLMTAQELDNLSTFIGSGRRAVFIGENSSFNAWNAQLMGLVGGATIISSSAPAITPAVSNELTDGISCLPLATAGQSTGGTSLFVENQFAMLWGANQNVLSILDINVFQLGFGSCPGGVPSDAPRFADNVATWLAGGAVVNPPVPVPEPGTTALALVALSGLAIRRVVSRRRVVLS